MTLTSPDYTTLHLIARSYAQTSSSLGIPLDGSVPFSIDAWLKIDGLCANMSFLSQEDSFQFGTQGNRLILQIPGMPPAVSGAVLTEDWHYVCVTYGGSQVRFYVDGYFNSFSSIAGSGSSGSTPFLIGNDLQAAVYNVRVYNTTLLATAVMDNMFNDPPSSTIVCWLDFSQNPPKDLGPGNLQIALQAGAKMMVNTPALGMLGTAFAQPLRDGSVNPGGFQTDPYTIQGWVYVNSSIPASQTIFVNGGNESDTGVGLALQWNGSSGFAVLSQRGADVNGAFLESTALVSLNTWTNVATTYDGTTLSIYIDGTLDKSQAFGPLPLISNEGQPMIGASYSEGQPSGADSLQGFISDIEVWNVALTAQEIAEYMTDTPGSDTDGITAVYDFTGAGARNQVTQHPVGLADGALVTEQVSHTMAASAPLGRRIQHPAPPEPLPSETLHTIRESLDFRALADEQQEVFRAAMEADLEIFVGDDARRRKTWDVWNDALERLRTNPASLPFFVTEHRIGNERVLLCHRNGVSTVVYRASQDEVDDCTMWKVQLVFVVVGGVLDAAFGLTSSLSTKAVKVIARIVRNPIIAARLAVGAGVTSALLLGVMTALYSQGFLMEIVRLIASVGFWTILRIAAKLGLYAVGAGIADLLASLAATVVTFIVTWNARPASCNTIPAVNLAALKFNWDPTGSSVDALTIRKNYTTVAPSPEWTPAMTAATQSPAAYAIASVTGAVIQIQAKFTINTLAAASATVSATGGGILGSIASFTVNFANGVSVPEFVTVSLPNHTFGAGGGVGVQNVTWNWTFQIGSSGSQTLATTSHRIYSVLGVPTGPWQQGGAASQEPWTDVLDYSCVWAAGATDATAAANAVTTEVNGAIGLTYDTHSGASVYTQWASSSSTYIFLCTQFLLFLSQGTGKGNVVNCSDCATIVTTFANSVGCNLSAAWMANPSAFNVFPPNPTGFSCNEIVAIGGTAWAYPFPRPSGGGAFSYHEVAWTGAGSYTDPLYDACLKVDNSSNPWTWPGGTHTAQLPLLVPFTTQGVSPALPIATPFNSWSYRERLCTNNASGIGICTPLGPLKYTGSGRRPVQ